MRKKITITAITCDSCETSNDKSGSRGGWCQCRLCEKDFCKKCRKTKITTMLTVFYSKKYPGIVGKSIGICEDCEEKLLADFLKKIIVMC